MIGDPTQLQQLLGINMAIVLIALFNIAGSIALSLYFGWKLTLLAICTTMPIILFSGYLRIRYEVQFESMNHAVFAESSKFCSRGNWGYQDGFQSHIGVEYLSKIRRFVDKSFETFAEKSEVVVFCFCNE
jgi:ATP-binding cassette subfamily B (MDR/TAP) protein 1